MVLVLTSKVQKREDSGQLTITIPRDFARIYKIEKGMVFEFVSGDGVDLEEGDIILRRKR